MFQTPRASKRRKLSATTPEASETLDTRRSGSTRRSTRSTRLSPPADSASLPLLTGSTRRRRAGNRADHIEPSDELTSTASHTGQDNAKSSRAARRHNKATSERSGHAGSGSAATTGAKRRRVATSASLADSVDSGSSEHFSADELADTRSSPAGAMVDMTPSKTRRGASNSSDKRRRGRDSGVGEAEANSHHAAEEAVVLVTPRSRKQTSKAAESAMSTGRRGRPKKSETPRKTAEKTRARKPRAQKPQEKEQRLDAVDPTLTDADAEIPEDEDDQGDIASLIDRIAHEDTTDTAPLMNGDIEQHGLSTGAASPAFEALRRIAISKLTSHRPIPLQNLSQERRKVHTLLHATVTASEGNSMLLLGPRGTGKSALVRDVLRELEGDAALRGTFHSIHLDGMIQTDDRLALKEIWRQLGREMELDDDDDNSGSKSYADMLTTLLGVLSHPEELAEQKATSDKPAKHIDGVTAHSIIFVLDSFEAFASRPRQTLLYNLFDVAQSRKAPIAVLGLTPRLDAPDLLEKRVKSRFSHRTVLIPAAKTLDAFVGTVRAAARVEPAELTPAERAALTPAELSLALSRWNAAVDGLLAQPATRSTLTRIYHTTKAIPEALSALLIPLHTLAAPPAAPPAAAALLSATLRAPPAAPLHLPAQLPALALALLIAAARLPLLHGAPHANFALAYAEYRRLAAAARVSGAAAAGGAVVARVWGREVARGAWEALVRAGLVVPEAGGGTGVGVGVGETGMCRVEIGLEEIEGAAGGALDGVMARWCREL